MNKKQELTHEIDTIILILAKAHAALEIKSYLETENSRSIFWDFILYLSIKEVVIELDKLTSQNENQKYNMHKLINKLSPSGEYRSLKFSKKTYDGLIDLLNSETTTITNINNARNKLYAHTDRDKSSVKDLNLKTIDLQTIIDNLNKSLNLISIELLDVQIRTKPIIRKENLNFFQNLEQLQKIKRDQLISKINMSKK